MAGLFSRIKNWVTNETLRSSDVNAEFNNIITNFNPDKVDDYSTNVSQMQTMTSPGAVGTESLATSTAGEIERLRYVIDRIVGGPQWYSAPPIDLTIADELINDFNSLPANRVVVGKQRSTSEQPLFLDPDGTTNSIFLRASVGVPFSAYIDSVLYTLTADVTFTGLALAPSTNNTALVADAALAGAFTTRWVGEDDQDKSSIQIGTVGTEITSRVGTYQAFKIVSGGNTEYFTAYISAVNFLSNIYRGFFFDSSDNPINRIAISNGDTITLMKMAWVFLKSDGTLDVTYNAPFYSHTTPGAGVSGDYWLDLVNDTWKKHTGTFVAANAVYLGVCFQDTAGCKGARSVYFHHNANAHNAFKLAVQSTTEIRALQQNPSVFVLGRYFEFGQDLPKWNITTQLESGQTEAVSRTYYAYITEAGAKVLSETKPYQMLGSLRGYYHPHQTWRCVGAVENNASSNLEVPIFQEVFFTKAPHKASGTIARGGNGHGGTSTAIRRFTATSALAADGSSGISVSDAAATGTVFTIVEPGIYSITYWDYKSTGGTSIGVSVNSSQLTTSIDSITATNAAVLGSSFSNAGYAHVSVTTYLVKGDVVRAHTDTTPNATTDILCQFLIIKVIGAEDMIKP